MKPGILLLLSAFCLSSCYAQKQPEPENFDAEQKPTADTNDTIVPPPPDITSLVMGGDRSACSNEQVLDTVKNISMPKFTDEAEQNRYNSYHDNHHKVFNIGQWSGYWNDNTSFNNIVPVDFDNFSKKMNCKAEFIFNPMGGINIVYSIQPTADNSDIYVEVTGPITSPESKFALVNKLYESVTAFYDSGID